jgi:hypothetical protein
MMTVLAETELWETRDGSRRSAQVLDRHVDQPGAQRALLLVGLFPVVLHVSLLE